jgi:hypothetical protein
MPEPRTACSDLDGQLAKNTLIFEGFADFVSIIFGSSE